MSDQPKTSDGIHRRHFLVLALILVAVAVMARVQRSDPPTLLVSLSTRSLSRVEVAICQDQLRQLNLPVRLNSAGDGILLRAENRDRALQALGILGMPLEPLDRLDGKSRALSLGLTKKMQDGLDLVFPGRAAVAARVDSETASDFIPNIKQRPDFQCKGPGTCRRLPQRDVVRVVRQRFWLALDIPPGTSDEQARLRKNLEAFVGLQKERGDTLVLRYVSWRPETK